MKLLPYENLTIHTVLSAEEARQRLESIVEPKRSFRFFETTLKPYQGQVDGLQFEISRIIHYRNSFLPMIKGEIRPEMSGCSIYITMRLHIAVIVFMICWFGVLGLIFVPTLIVFIASFTQNRPIDPWLLIPGGMLVFGYLLSMSGFTFEAVKSRKFFRELFQAEAFSLEA